jgi:hypothetical protein
VSTSEGCGSEKPEQAQFSLTLHFTCNEKLTLFIHNLKTHNAMNKTVKTVLKVLGYIIAALLGAAGEATMM